MLNHKKARDFIHQTCKAMSVYMKANEHLKKKKGIITVNFL